MYSFERNDRNSFAYSSRVYDVFEGDDRTSPILSLVVGYDQIMNEYFVCYLATEPFNSDYGHYPDRSINTWQEVMSEFIMLFECVFDKTDIIQENHFTKERIEEMPDLTRDNLLYYSSSCDYDEIKETPIVIDENECVINVAIEREYLIPAYFEKDNETDMSEYTPDNFLKFIESNHYTESMYFTIDFDELNN